MIILVDLSACFYRNYHATGSGHGAYTETIEHMSALRECGDTIIICCEGGRLIRKSYFDGYKANRDPKPPDVLESLREIIAELKTWETFYVIAVDGYEADDVIYTIAKYATEEVRVLTADKDIYQCISDTVSLVANGKLVGVAECVEKFGVRPSQIRDFLTICGDASDNIPGCPGLGAVKAANLLQRFDTIEGIQAATNAELGLGPKTLEKFRSWDPTLARRLTTLLEIPEIAEAFTQKPTEQEEADMADMSKIVTERKNGPLKILAYGPEGVGKTRFGAFANRPIFLCAENGLSAPDLKSVPAFPAPENWADVMAAIEHLRTTEHGYKTLVVDSIDWLYQFAKSDVCIREKMSISQFEEYGRGEKFAFDYWIKLMRALDALQESRGMHVIALAHSSMKVFQNPQGEDFMRYQLALADKACERWKQWPDFLLFMSQEIFTKKTKDDKGSKGIIGDHQIFTSRTAAFDAKSRVRLPESIPYDTANPWSAFSGAVREAVTPPKQEASVDQSTNQTAA